jgi:hypothetical protein
MAGTGGCANETSFFCGCSTAGGFSESEKVGELGEGGESDVVEVALLLMTSLAKVDCLACCRPKSRWTKEEREYVERSRKTK